MILYNNKKVQFGRFPNGEVNLNKIKIDPRDLNHVVTLKYEDDSDLFHLLLVRKALSVPATLRIMYVPYSRMDRESDTYTFSLKVFCDFINSMNWEKVIVYEPHSDVTPALLDRVEVVPVTTLLLSTLDQLVATEYQIYYPDAGAQKRYPDTPNSLLGIKRRDFKTGKIIDQQVIGERSADVVVIMDDLCSKGGTFVLAAEKLRKMGFKIILLVVAHTEETIFKGEVFDYIDGVVTTDSILDPSSEDALKYRNKLYITPLSRFQGVQ